MLRIGLILVFCMAARTPAPKESPRPTVAALRQAIGKSHLGKEVRTIGRQLGEYPTIKYTAWEIAEENDKGQEGTMFYLLWKAKGIDMHFLKGNLTAIWLFNEGADEHKRYEGQLPDGITFDDSREAIEKKLGKPTEVESFEPRRILGKGPLVEDMWLTYPNGMGIQMRRPKDGKWAIHYISLYEPAADE